MGDGDDVAVAHGGEGDGGPVERHYVAGPVVGANEVGVVVGQPVHVGLREEERGEEAAEHVRGDAEDEGGAEDADGPAEALEGLVLAEAVQLGEELDRADEAEGAGEAEEADEVGGLEGASGD